MTAATRDRTRDLDQIDTVPIADNAARLLRGLSDHTRRLALSDHLAVHDSVPAALTAGQVDLLDSTEAVDLRGRGGAAFSFTRKARGVRAAGQEQGREPLVVGNGSEGEPASHKDARLMQCAPHLVLDGAELAAAAVGSGEARIVVGAPAAARSLDAALCERGHGRVRVRVVPVVDRFVTGESSAAVRAAERGDAIPAFTVRRTGEGGVNGRPTLVSNVETLAQLALLARLGAAGYRRLGTPDDAGTTLLTVHRGLGAEVVEVAYGTSLAAVLGDAPVGPGVLLGGYHGTFLPASRAATTVLSRAEAADAGATLGAGVVVVLPPGCCPLVEAAPVVRFLAAESAGQCGPCVHGLRAIAERVTELADGCCPPEGLAQLERWRGLVSGRGACGHPDGVVRFVSSLLTAFPTEVAMHQHGSCGRPSRTLFPLGDAR